MPDLTFDSKVSASASDALEPYVRPMYDAPGKRLMAIIELAHVERTQPAPGSEKTAKVKCRIVGLEIPNSDQEQAVREAQRALYLHRTATGSLDEDSGELELSEQTLRLTGGMLHALEASRLRAGLSHWQHYAQRVRHNPDLTHSECLRELHQIADGLRTLLNTASPDDGEAA